MHEIILAPSDRRRLGTVNCGFSSLRSQNAPPPLAQLVHEKTAGNPFFAIQFISALAEEGLLTFDHDARAMVLGPRSHSRQRLHR